MAAIASKVPPAMRAERQMSDSRAASPVYSQAYAQGGTVSKTAQHHTFLSPSLSPKNISFNFPQVKHMLA